MNNMDKAIIEGLEKGGRDESELEHIQEVLKYNPYVYDEDDARLFAQAFVLCGTRSAVEDMMDDFMYTETKAVTGCDTGKEVVDLYLGKPTVETSDLWEIYYGDENNGEPAVFVLDII